MWAAIRFVFRAVAALTAAGAIVVAAAAWRLSAGPLTLAFLTPYLQEALSYNGDYGFLVELDDTILSWAGWERTLDISAVGLRVRRPDGTLIAAIPRISLGLSGSQLLRGHIQPTSIDLIGAQGMLTRDADGAIELDLGAGMRRDVADFGAGFLAQFLADPDPSRQTGLLSRIGISGAGFTLVDRPSGSEWRARRADLTLWRHDGGFNGEAFIDLDLDGELVHLAVAAVHAASSSSTTVSVRFSEVEPPRLAASTPRLRALADVRLPLSGEVRFVVDARAAVSQVAFDISGGAGSIALAGLLAEDLALTQASARGRLLEGFSGVQLDELYLDTGRGKVEMTATANLGADGVRVMVAGAFHGVPVDDMRRFWPPDAAPDARRWVLERLHGGSVDEAHFNAAFDLDPDGEMTESGSDDVFSMTFRFSGVDTRYFDPLPELREAAGSGKIDGQAFELHLEHARLGALDITEGAVEIETPGVAPDRAAISFVASGEIAEALAILDREPLGFARALGIAPAEIAGLSSARVRLGLDLDKPVSAGDIEFAAAANLAEVAVPSLLDGLGFSEGELSLRIDQSGLEASGTVTVAEVPLAVSWREEFAQGAEAPASYVVTGTLDADAQDRLGLVLAPYVNGPIGFELHAVRQPSDETLVSARVDLTAAAIDLPPLKWSKARGIAGTLRATVIPGPDGALAIEAFTVDAGGLAASGQAELGPGRTFRRLDLSSLAVAGSDLSVSVRPRAGGGYVLALNGRRLNLEPYVDEMMGTDAGSERPPLNLSVRLDELVFSPGQRLSSLTGEAAYDGLSWNEVTAEGQFGSGGRPLALSVTQKGPRLRELKLTTADAGALARAVGIYENARGGALVLSAEIEDALPSRRISGSMRIGDFVVVDAPVLAQILTLAPLPGVFDGLNGTGIEFLRLEAPFTLGEGVLTLEGARAFGPRLGLTIQGYVDMRRDEIALDGTLVPAYTLNALLGNIPVLGGIFVGKKGGGVFALTYRVNGPASDPQVTVNPLAALAPGFLRGFFSILDGRGAPPGEPSTGEDR